MNLLEGLTPKVTRHFKEKVQSEGFDPHEVIEVVKNPEKVFKSSTHASQYRILGKGFCIIGEQRGQSLVLITCYEDGVMTPPRPDQLKSAEGLRYAKRYYAGLGRRNYG